MSAFSVDIGRQTPPLVDGVVHNRLVTDIFITSLATLSLGNKQVNACPVLYIFSGFGTAKIIEIDEDLTELQSNVYCRIHLFSSLVARLFNKLTRYSCYVL